MAAQRTQSRCLRPDDSSRNSSDGLTSRTCSKGTTENSSDTRMPTPTPWAAALNVTP